MNVSVIGVGYVGLITGACLAEFGMNVLCMDTDIKKIDRLKQGDMPIYEPGLAEIIHKNYFNNKRIDFTSELKKAVNHGDIIFLAVDTPTKDDDSSDLNNVMDVARGIGREMNCYKVIVNKSTVPVGTGKVIIEEIRSILKIEKKDIEFDFVSNPEFLREGTGVKDFINTERIVIGSNSEKAVEIMKKLYNIQILFGIPLIVTSIESAEMIKYASNAFLAAKISFINEIAILCELCNSDVCAVSKAMGLDGRIGNKFLNPGPGYGGSCFPKDTRALVGIGRKLGYVPEIIKSVIKVNENQKKIILEKIEKSVGNLDKKVITILGVSFKPETDDIRESPSIYIIKELLKKNSRVKVFDPEAMKNLKIQYPELNVEYCEDMYSACEESQCLVVLTEWSQFLKLDFSRLKKIMKASVLIDTRNVFDPEKVKECGFEYVGTGRK